MDTLASDARQRMIFRSFLQFRALAMLLFERDSKAAIAFGGGGSQGCVCWNCKNQTRASDRDLQTHICVGTGVALSRHYPLLRMLLKTQYHHANMHACRICLKRGTT
ncbi:MAG: hypothetical protein AAFN63_09455 [Pseudomonadota bacterium]